MNPISQENSNSYENLDIAKEPNVVTPPKRTYTKRGNKTLAKAPTIASLTEEIEAKNLEIEAIQADINGLMAKRNELFLYESVGMGLMAIIADPEKAKLLVRFVEESNERHNQ